MAQPAKHEPLQPPPSVTPAGFVRDAARSHGDPRSDNALVHGENLDAMRRLAHAGFAGRFRCIYLDPPFNSGRRFAEYDDALAPEAWRAMMRERLEAARELWPTTAPIFVEIDDTELGPLQVAMDERLRPRAARLDRSRSCAARPPGTRPSTAARST